MGIGQNLLEMKAKIEEHKKDKSQSEGALALLQKRLLDEHEMASYEDACVYIETLEKECEEDETTLKENMKELREKFNV